MSDENSPILVRSLKSHHIGTKEKLLGIVRSVSTNKIAISTAVFRCKCGHESTKTFATPLETLTNPSVCEEFNGGCGRKSTQGIFELLDEESEYFDYREILLELDHPDDFNSKPNYFLLLLLHDESTIPINSTIEFETMIGTDPRHKKTTIAPFGITSEVILYEDVFGQPFNPDAQNPATRRDMERLVAICVCELFTNADAPVKLISIQNKMEQHRLSSSDLEDVLDKLCAVGTLFRPSMNRDEYMPTG